MNLVPNQNIGLPLRNRGGNLSYDNINTDNNGQNGLNRNYQEQFSNSQINNIQFNSANRGNTPIISSSNDSNYNINKITAIISSWNLKFDGSPTGLTVEEFLYRVRSLTNDTFNGDFTPIVKNLNVLLNGKAKDWYWRYRKQIDVFNWDDFCEAMKCQYRDFKSSFDIREEIRNRKQKVGETFDAFYDSISSIMDRLHSPMSEMELIEIIRNLRPEIRQEILYIPVHSISHLRKLVQMRELFLNDEYVRKNLPYRIQNNFVPKKHISEINFSDDNQNYQSSDVSENEINALQLHDKVVRCWNCDELGHFWDDCLKGRNIFCYGCGAKNTYKPQCPKCSSRKINLPKNLKTPETMKNQ